MLVDGINLIQGSDIINAVVDSGSAFPSSPDVGELFYKTSATVGLYVYDGASWTAAGSGGGGLTGGLADQIPYMSAPDTVAFSTGLQWNNAARVLTVGAAGNSSITNAFAGGGLSLTTLAGSGAVGGITLAPGASSAGSGGSVSITGGSTAGIGQNPGNITLTGGAATVNSNGGQVTIVGGAGLGSERSGGDINIRAGLAGTGGYGGHILFSTATSTTLVERMRITRDGALSFNGANNGGVAGQVLTSNGQSSAPTWAGISEASIADGTLLARVGGNEVITGTWTFNNPVAGATPTVDTHLATKAYVDTVATGLDPKNAVRAATTANITLSGTQTVDGVALVAGDRVLVKNQSAATQNGIYVVASGAWTRSPDADDSPDGEVTSGMYTLVTEGTVSTGTGYVLTTPDPITLGVTSLSFSPFSSTSGPAAAGTLTGTTLAANVVSSSLTTVGTLSSLSVGGATTGARMHVFADNASRVATFETTTSTTAAIQLKNTGSGAFPAQLLSISDDMGFQTAGVTQFRINTVGALGIGNAASYGTAGQVLTTAGAGGAATWADSFPRKLPRAASYSGTTADNGYRAVITGGVAIPASVYAAGDAFSLYNSTDTPVTITEGVGLTLRQDGTANTGDRTLAAYGSCFIWFNTSTEAIINGSIS